MTNGRRLRQEIDVALSPWPAAAIKLRLNYHGLDDGDVAKFSAERAGLHFSVTCRPEHERWRWNVVVVHGKFPRGVVIVGASAPEAEQRRVELITGDPAFDKEVRILAGGAGVLSILTQEMRKKTRELFTETRARIARARIELDEATETPSPGPLARHIDLALWIGRRLAHPMTLAGLVNNILDDPHLEVKMANLRTLARIDADALDRLPAQTHGLDLTSLIARARLEAHAAGRLSLAPIEDTRGALSETGAEGALSIGAADQSSPAKPA